MNQQLIELFWLFHKWVNASLRLRDTHVLALRVDGSGDLYDFSGQESLFSWTTLEQGIEKFQQWIKEDEALSDL